jgi:signal transduction histidine kinase
VVPSDDGGAALGLALALYQLRLRRVAWHFNMRLEERVNERTRVARDLHDTLLQSFHAVVLRLQAVTFLPLLKPGRRLNMSSTTRAGDRGSARRRPGAAFGDGREQRLSVLISALGEELTASPSDKSAPALSVNVEGRAREIVPIVRDEIYRIAREALRNAFRHADASRIQVEIRYAPRVLRVRIRDGR